MSNKERNKRSARKARQEERKRLEAEHIASGHAAKAEEAPKVSLLKKASSDSAAAKPAKAEKAKKPGRIRSYFTAVKTEMHQVTWPSRKELKNYSFAVIAMLLVFGVCVWAVDNGFVALILAFTGLRG